MVLSTKLKFKRITLEVFLVTVTPIEDEEGNIMGSVHVARDITKRVKMENDLKKL